MANNMKWFSTK